MANIIEFGKRKSALMLRAGGLGDCLILTPVAKALHERGYNVDFFIGSPTGDVHELMIGLPYLRTVKKMGRIRNLDCVEDEFEHKISVEILKKTYDEVFDFKYSVEDNYVPFHTNEGWRGSINSNYQNWVDLSLSWCNIDPTKVKDEDKRPEIGTSLADIKYKNWLCDDTPIQPKGERDYKVIGIQLQASSLVRTWYNAHLLPELIHKQFPNDVVIVFSNNWICITPSGRIELKFPEGLNPLLCSAYLIAQMDCFISADSGSSHIAEAVGTHSIDIYTTVPAWTRVKYYKYAHALEPVDVACHPCFTLDTFCPLEKKKAEDTVSDREKDIITASQSGVPIQEVARKYGVPPKAIQMELESTLQRQQALATSMPACVKSITDKHIMDKVSEILGSIMVKKKLTHVIFNDAVLMGDRNE